MTENLLPCPFCGGEAEHRLKKYKTWKPRATGIIQCSSCLCNALSEESWQTRTQPPQDGWRDISEWHDDYHDCLFAFFIAGNLQGVEFTSPLTTDFYDWKYDRALFKHVSMPTSEIEALLAQPAKTDGGGS